MINLGKQINLQVYHFRCKGPMLNPLCTEKTSHYHLMKLHGSTKAGTNTISNQTTLLVLIKNAINYISTQVELPLYIVSIFFFTNFKDL
jgi:hypothetical protein